jgi:hypothetical protein
MATTQRAASPPSDPPALAPPHTPTSKSKSSSSASRPPTTVATPGFLHPEQSRPAPTSISNSNPSAKFTKSKHNQSYARSPVALTGVAAIAETKRRDRQQLAAADAERRTSPNPAVQAMQALMGGGGTSRPTDSPAPNKLSEPLRKAAEKISIPKVTQGASLETSPVSMSSYGSIETTGAGANMTATANQLSDQSGQHTYVAEPADMSESGTYSGDNGHLNVTSDDAHKAFSYPGPPPQEHDRDGPPSRGLSLPGYGQSSPKSPVSSGKRHKCPYCSTDFTRHHNLKSHLLTHSQEKPYVCQTCNARFRRLHDLKRHTKLHTGERPHTCDKCGRRFARGDALARHNKGPGGCAGRRSSVGGEDEFFGRDGEGMDGMEYPDDEDDEDIDASARRESEPSRKRTHLETPQDVDRQVYRQHSNTYPPPAQQHQRGDMAPPQATHPAPGAIASPRDMSGHPSPAAGASIAGAFYNGVPGQVFQQHGVMMTESPKPLSPGQPPDHHRLSVTDPNGNTTMRNRSPSLTAQFHQQQFGRGNGGRTPPQHPHAQFPQASQAAPQLPPLPIPAMAAGTVNQPQGRASMQTSGFSGPGPSSLHQHQLPPQSGNSSSNPGSMSSHGRSSGSSMREVLASGTTGQHDPQGQGDIWNYVRSIEQRFSRMQDEYELRISRMQEEIFQLKGQMSNNPSYSSDMVGGPPSAPRY